LIVVQATCRRRFNVAASAFKAVRPHHLGLWRRGGDTSSDRKLLLFATDKAIHPRCQADDIRSNGMIKLIHQIHPRCQADDIRSNGMIKLVHQIHPRCPADDIRSNGMIKLIHQIHPRRPTDDIRSNRRRV
jgi:hypothetical protein